MGGIFIVTQAADLPARLSKSVENGFCTFEDAYNNFEVVKKENHQSTTFNFFSEILLRGAVTPTGAGILATIKAGPKMIYIIPVCSWYFNDTSNFSYNIPAVIYNLRRRYKIKSTGVTMSHAVVLFHELGHAAQMVGGSPFYVETQAKFEDTKLNNQKRQKAYMKIENDNLVRHEAPLCGELGEPVRQNYDDIE